ncbi:protein lifeguard 2-like [Bacillus rossius redtenbacheri]|uniref:protein lifeguard 2-like n=1 Tax=Bacillus rossius redtenbacheri TaxID=93214 RepID=UPI002FDE41D9
MENNRAQKPPDASKSSQSLTEPTGQAAGQLPEQPAQVDVPPRDQESVDSLQQQPSAGPVFPIIVINTMDPRFHRQRQFNTTHDRHYRSRPYPPQPLSYDRSRPYPPPQTVTQYSPRPYPPQYLAYDSTRSRSSQPVTFVLDDFVFNDMSVRRAFIRKVYSILMIQLLLTFGIISLFVFHEPTKQYILRNSHIWWISVIVMFATIFAMTCFTSVRRNYPTNFIFLFIFTVASGFMLGSVAATFEGDAVLMAVGATAAVCFGLTLFAFQTKWDFTVLRGALLGGLIILFIFGIVVMFFPGRLMMLIYSSLGAFLFSLYLVADTQMIIGGNHKYSFSPEDYIFAVLTLYLDIVNIFLNILAIVGIARS